jgi:hypothetical protein
MLEACCRAWWTIPQRSVVMGSSTAPQRPGPNSIDLISAALSDTDDKAAFASPPPVEQQPIVERELAAVDVLLCGA